MLNVGWYINYEELEIRPPELEKSTRTGYSVGKIK
jgi:hypothetical protein